MGGLVDVTVAIVALFIWAWKERAPSIIHRHRHYTASGAGCKIIVGEKDRWS